MDERRESEARTSSVAARCDPIDSPRLNVVPFVAPWPRRSHAATAANDAGGGRGNVVGIRPLHIAVVTDTYPPEFNETARAVAGIVARLRQLGHRVSLVRPRQVGEGPAKEPATLLVHGLPLPMSAPLTLGLPITARLGRQWRRQRPDLVHVATVGLLGASALTAAERLGIAATTDYRFNLHPFSGRPPPDWAQPALSRWLSRFHARSALTFAPSAKAAAQLRLTGVDRVAVVESGVDTFRFSPAWRSTALRHAWGANDAAAVVLGVGPLADGSNVGLVARAIAEIRRRDRRARLVWIGEGPLRQALQRVHPDTVFAGALHGAPLAAAYASADVLLFPELINQTSDVVLEALASGLVVVAYDGIAAARYIEDGYSGYLVPADIECLFVVTSTLAATRIRQHESMRRQAREAAQRAALPPAVDRFEAHLRAILRQRDAAAGERRSRQSPDPALQTLRS